MIRTQVSLPKEDYESVKREAARQGISISALLRKALRAVLPRNQKKPWMRYAGMVASGDPASSRTIDEIVYGEKD